MTQIDLEQVKTRILNFVRSYPGYGIDKVSVTLSIPMNIVRSAVAELQQKGLLLPGSYLKIGRRQS